VTLRIFSPKGELIATDDLLAVLVDARVSALADESGDILAVTSNEEHAYNAQTEVWLLPPSGDPRVLLDIQGTFGGFTGRRRVDGVRVGR